MQRKSTKHGARADDELGPEQLKEEAGDVLAAGDVPVETDHSETSPTQPSPDAVEARRELSRHLRLSAFPATRDGLLAEATQQNAPEHVIAALKDLPPELELHTVHEVWAALEGHEDVREAARHEPLTEGDR